jgi:hypothetical protein
MCLGRRHGLCADDDSCADDRQTYADALIARWPCAYGHRQHSLCRRLLGLCRWLGAVGPLSHCRSVPHHLGIHVGKASLCYRECVVSHHLAWFGCMELQPSMTCIVPLGISFVKIVESRYLCIVH